MLQYIEEIDKILSEYVLSKQAIEAEDYEAEIAEKVKKYEEKLREEYAAKKANEIKDIDISIEAVKRVREKLMKYEQDTITHTQANINIGVK